MIADRVLVFDNVRPARLTLGDMLGGRVAVRVAGALQVVPEVLRALPALDGPGDITVA